MQDQIQPAFSKTRLTMIVLGLFAILIAIGFVGIKDDFFWLSKNAHVQRWLLIMGLLAVFSIVSGYGITGRWRGILIDQRNKLSLARLQLLGWTLLVLSAYFSAVLMNMEFGEAAATSVMNVEIPSQLWVVMGISTGSAVGASALMAQKATDAKAAQYLHKHDHPNRARWGDLLMGDTTDSSDTVDLGKMQMFLFSFILILAYAAVIADQFSSPGFITSLPPVEDGMNVLLGISHTGYLSKKAINRTPTPSASND